MKRKHLWLNFSTGLMLLILGAFMSSSIWARLYAKTWPLVEAEVTGIEWRSAAGSNSAIATVYFKISSDATVFSDSIFRRPFRKKNVLLEKESITAEYAIGSGIRVRFHEGRAKLDGFPESYANGGFLQFLVGLMLLVAFGRALIAERKEVRSSIGVESVSEES